MNADIYQPANHHYHIGKVATLLDTVPNAVPGAGETTIETIGFAVDGVAVHINFIRKIIPLASGANDSFSYCILTHSDVDTTTALALLAAALRHYKLQLLLAD